MCKIQIQTDVQGEANQTSKVRCNQHTRSFHNRGTNKYSGLLEMDEEEQGPEELCEEMVKVTKEAAESCIPKKQKMRKQWLTEDTLDIAKRRREAKASGNQQKWRDLDGEYNQQTLEVRRNYLGEKCQEAENAHQVGNLDKVFSVVRELNNKCSPSSDVINDSNGNTLTQETKHTSKLDGFNIALTEMGFTKHLVDLMAKLYEDQHSSVRTSAGDMDWFSIERGIRQGCILSPYLFNIYSERIMRGVKAEFEGDVQIGGERLNNL